MRQRIYTIQEVGKFQWNHSAIINYMAFNNTCCILQSLFALLACICSCTYRAYVRAFVILWMHRQTDMHIDHILPDKCVLPIVGLYITHNLPFQALIPTSDNLLTDMLPPTTTNSNNSNTRSSLVFLISSKHPLKMQWCKYRADWSRKLRWMCEPIRFVKFSRI